MENLGGSVACESKPGEGTSFYLKFLNAGGSALIEPSTNQAGA
jgi:signal transduction histidine kinase